MLPSSVESNVEQYLKKNCFAPAFFNQFIACRDCSIASSTGIVRVFNAIITASTEGTTSFLLGVPNSWIVFKPPLTSIFARSVAPVKSSAMQPSVMGMLFTS